MIGGKDVVKMSKVQTLSHRRRADPSHVIASPSVCHTKTHDVDKCTDYILRAIFIGISMPTKWSCSTVMFDKLAHPD